MKLFVDTADLKQITKIQQWCPLDGVTTNPSLVAKSGMEHHSLIQSICKEVPGGEVSAEVLGTTAEAMCREAEILSALHSQVVVKLPLTQEGLKATAQLKKKNISTNLTLCFSALQALLAAKAGAAMVSVFVGRLDDMGLCGMAVVQEVIDMFCHYQIKTEVLVASVRHISHILEAGQLGADTVTIPPALFEKMVKHPLTDKGLDQFLQSARESRK